MYGSKSNLRIGSKKEVMKIAVVGGSLGGLTAALALREVAKKMPALIDPKVDVYEKSPTRLTDGGAGIVLQPEVSEALNRYTELHDGRSTGGVEVHLKYRQFAERDGTFRRAFMPQAMTSWEAVWKRLREAFPDESYHSGVRVTGVQEQSDGRLRLVTTTSSIDGDDTTCKSLIDQDYDIVVAADGAGSMIREQFLPNTTEKYAGYVAYRGTLPVKDATPDILDFFPNSFSMYTYPNSRQHILVYLIPGLGGSTDPTDLRSLPPS